MRTPIDESKLKNLFSIISKGDDLSIILRSEHYIHDTLSCIIKDRISDKRLAEELINYKRRYLGGTHQKGKLLHSSKIINKSAFKSIQKLLEIRNKFAHTDKEVTFETPEIRKLCSELFELHVVNKDNLEDFYSAFSRTGKEDFIIKIVLLISHLHIIQAKSELKNKNT